jgi:hypothetical protein
MPEGGPIPSTPNLSDNRTSGFWPDFHFSDYRVYQALDRNQ